ncbi:MAG: restriction endonuclease subunit S [Roseomonas sp.]|nr:restriction endonuclease subunit S [Roseomonas sp.]
MAWPSVTLGDVCVARTGTEDPRSRASGQFTYIDISSVDASKKVITGARVMSANEAPSRARRKICEHDVLVSMTRPNLNAVAKVNASLAGEICSTGFSVLRAGPRLNAAYLFHFVQTPRFVDALSGLTAGALYPAVTETQVRQQLIPLPPLAEQQRIVEILDRAAAIQRLRRAAEEKAREIIPALFVDMFGDPATNPKGWPMRKLEDVATVDRGRSRHRPRDDKALYNGSYPFIQTSEVANSGGLITQYTTTYSEFGLAQSKQWPSGTLCVTIAANIAKTGILQFAACFPDSVVAVIPGSTTNNEFLQAWLAFLQPTLEAQAPQLAQKNINLEILRALAVPIPPKSLQDKFSELCQRVRAMQALNDNSATVAISANQSLASTLFSAA